MKAQIKPQHKRHAARPQKPGKKMSTMMLASYRRQRGLRGQAHSDPLYTQTHTHKERDSQWWIGTETKQKGAGTGQLSGQICH